MFGRVSVTSKSKQRSLVTVHTMSNMCNVLTALPRRAVIAAGLTRPGIWPGVGYGRRVLRNGQLAHRQNDGQ